MTWELCRDGSEYLIDLWGGVDESTSWQAAKKHFAAKGYFGRFLLIRRSRNGNVKLWQVNIKKEA